MVRCSMHAMAWPCIVVREWSWHGMCVLTAQSTHMRALDLDGGLMTRQIEGERGDWEQVRGRETAVEAYEPWYPEELADDRT